jgi:hypothetical protein
MRKLGQIKIIIDNDGPPLPENLQAPTPTMSSPLSTPPPMMPGPRLPDKVDREMPPTLTAALSRVLEPEVTDPVGFTMRRARYRRSQAWSKEEDNVIAEAIEKATKTGMVFDRGSIWCDVANLVGQELLFQVSSVLTSFIASRSF